MLSNVRTPPKSPPPLKPPTPTSRYPSRVRHEPERLAPTMKGKSYDKPPRYLSALAAALALTNTVQVSPPTVHLLQHQAIGMDPFTGIQEFGHPGMLQSPMALTAMAMKAKKSKVPDIPSTREALSGPYAEEFWQSIILWMMNSEVSKGKIRGRSWTAPLFPRTPR